MLLQVFWTLGVIAAYFVLYSITTRFLSAYGKKKNISQKRIFYVEKYFNILSIALGLIAISLIWSIDYSGLLVFASSIFAVVGVGLFAQWSILSNITASVIIFFTMNARVGDKIRIVDGDNTVTGIIRDIGLFQLLLVDEHNNVITYPNNLVLQKPIIKLKFEESE